MSGNLNKVMLIGQLVADPATRYSATANVPVVTFTLATTRRSMSRDGELRDYTDEHSIVCFNGAKRQLADEVAVGLHKGSMVYVEGRLQTRSWEDREGIKQRVVEVVASEVRPLQRGRDELPLADELESA